MYSQPPPPQKKSNTVLWVVLAVVGVCGCGGVAIMGAILFPVFNQAKFAAKRTLGLSNVKQSATAVALYMVDNNDRLPEGEKWMDLADMYAKNPTIFNSPLVVDKDPNAYGLAFRKDLSQKKGASIDDHAKWAMIFDSTILTRNACSNLETLPVPGRYGGASSASANIIGFLDTHAKSIRDSDLGKKDFNGQPLIK